MLPTSSSPPPSSSCMSLLSRSLSLSQMDFPAALDQMSLLLSLNPSAVYKTSYYRKQTKNHWARDDPAFIILTLLLLLISTICYSIAFTLSFSGFLYLLTSNLLIYLLLGLLISLSTRHLSNLHLTTRRSHSVAQSVEPLYAFDIHCNSFLILFVYLHVIQFFLLPVLLSQSFLSLVLSNALYTAAFSHYFYITHLGYRALPFLTNTQYFLYPIVGFVGMFLSGIVAYPLGLSVNVARVVAMILF
mmetsp:Transcript_11105/g.20096  ORF Transcript_11105/g.20096 Transcript_11105/m.20096 type:complete len:245 (+) Transcript_11105:89-823(+)